jgi:alkylated DNA repair dioxygenase AlkB
MTEPRLTAEYPDLTSAPRTLQQAARTLTAHYGVTYDHLWLNLYRNHRDSTGWHGDGTSTRRRECVVAVLSLGAAVLGPWAVASRRTGATACPSRPRRPTRGSA